MDALQAAMGTSQFSHPSLTSGIAWGCVPRDLGAHGPDPFRCLLSMCLFACLLICLLACLRGCLFVCFLPASGCVFSCPQGCSNCNGGVNPENVACVHDPELGKTVLALTAHGDKYTGAGPAAILRNGNPRGANDEFSGWAWPSYHPSCSPYCGVRRVGGAVHTNEFFGRFQRVPMTCQWFRMPWIAFVT